MKKVCICGGGALGHVIAGYLSARGKADVSILTNHPSDWQHEITIFTPDNIHNKFVGKIDCNPLAELSQCILDSSNGSIINVI